MRETALYAPIKKYLKAQGYEKVKSVRGGMQAWMSEGHPLSLR